MTAPQILKNSVNTWIGCTRPKGKSMSSERRCQVSKLKTITPYYGGKFNKVGKFIAEILPNHRFYIEPCGGMAGVLMQKQPSFCEVYNDLDQMVVTLFEVVRCRESMNELVRKLNFTPYSRKEWQNCVQTFREEKDKVERARKVYVSLSMGFLGRLGKNSFSTGGTKYESSAARTYFNGLEALPFIHNRIKNIIIENQDCITVAKRWDNKETVFYWDNPYLEETRKTFNDYDNEMSPEKHMECLDFVTSCKSKVVMSGYLSEMYVSALESNGFSRIEIPTYCYSTYSTGKIHNPNRTECIWINYRPKDFSNPLFSSFQSKNPA